MSRGVVNVLRDEVWVYAGRATGMGWVRRDESHGMVRFGLYCTPWDDVSSRVTPAGRVIEQFSRHELSRLVPACASKRSALVLCCQAGETENGTR